MTKLWNDAHKRVYFSKEHYETLKKIKGKKTYDEVFGVIFKRLEGGI